MTTHLTLVAAHADAPATGAHTLGLEPRVFDARFLVRLAQLNHAGRELRAMGLHILRVMWVEPCVEVRIERDPHTSLGPLLDRMGKRNFRYHGDESEVWGEFEGVTVCWRERASLPAALQLSSIHTFRPL